MKAIIADDKEDVLSSLQQLLGHFDDISVVGVGTTGQELVDLVKKHNPDVVFIDIKMPAMSGIEAAKSFIAAGFHPAIVFVTGYDQFALDAFDVSAVDYIVKPITLAKLTRALERARNRPASLTSIRSQNQIYLNMSGSLVFLDTDQIIMAERQRKKTIVYCLHEILETTYSLTELEQKLNNLRFIRTHKSFLVNLSYIKEITRSGDRSYQISFKQIPHKALISRSYAEVIPKIQGVIDPQARK